MYHGHSNDFPMRSNKKIIRRLRNAKDRIVRNNLLSSTSPAESADAEESDDQNDDTVELMNVDGQDEEAQFDSTLLEDPTDDTPIVNTDLTSGEEIEEYTETDTENYAVRSSQPSTKEISTILALFRQRYRLSKACINELCSLLRHLGVHNVPTDFRSIEKNLTKDHENTLHAKACIVCTSCGSRGSSVEKCENVKCNSKNNFVSTPTKLYTFRILPQITSILERNRLISEPNTSDHSKIADVIEGQFLRNIHSKERFIESQRQIVSLLINSDGVLIKRFNRSVWAICMIINELPRNVRFNLDNLIICSLSMGGQKPKKHHFQDLIGEWVHELRQLELGFYILPNYSQHTFIKFHAYLIAAAMDKPAQSLLMNINECTGYYSCVRCTIKGKSVASGNGTIRAFIKDKKEKVQIRDNNLYDKCIHIFTRRKTKLKSGDLDVTCGTRGHCALRALTYFNIGPSFVTDSLHNIYSGAFKRLLDIWFKSRGDLYSIHKSLHVVEAQLDGIRYPSSTYHLPSQLRFFTRFKGNEYRMTLLFGYQYFKSVLPLQYYKHLKMLAFAMNLAESSALGQETIKDIEFLLNEFEELFPILYSSVNGPNVVVDELINNINILQCATAELKKNDFSSSLRNFVLQMFSSKRRAFSIESCTPENGYIHFGRALQLSNHHRIVTYLNIKGYRVVQRGMKNDDERVLMNLQQQLNTDIISKLDALVESSQSKLLEIHGQLLSKAHGVRAVDLLKKRDCELVQPTCALGKRVNNWSGSNTAKNTSLKHEDTRVKQMYDKGKEEFHRINEDIKSIYKSIGTVDIKSLKMIDELCRAAQSGIESMVSACGRMRAYLKAIDVDQDFLVNSVLDAARSMNIADGYMDTTRIHHIKQVLGLE
ncbi:unnamed protein product [Adineta ricciae]|uniref:Uncharacterized protein n=1 Tax=Adineta ricciae TaxID=249248 RepID=A0A815VH96_ADIRI|nr:unnamed protein product [Adineta ricciae]CAF1528923.1 unnamed protein product [Adineta ricciae]